MYDRFCKTEPANDTKKRNRIKKSQISTFVEESDSRNSEMLPEPIQLPGHLFSINPYPDHVLFTSDGQELRMPQPKFMSGVAEEQLSLQGILVFPVAEASLPHHDHQVSVFGFLACTI
jgi:hypothetical protein